MSLQLSHCSSLCKLPDRSRYSVNLRLRYVPIIRLFCSTGSGSLLDLRRSFRNKPSQPPRYRLPLDMSTRLRLPANHRSVCSVPSTFCLCFAQYAHLTFSILPHSPLIFSHIRLEQRRQVGSLRTGAAPALQAAIRERATVRAAVPQQNRGSERRFEQQRERQRWQEAVVQRRQEAVVQK